MTIEPDILVVSIGVEIDVRPRFRSGGVDLLAPALAAEEDCNIVKIRGPLTSFAHHDEQPSFESLSFRLFSAIDMAGCGAPFETGAAPLRRA